MDVAPVPLVAVTGVDGALYTRTVLDTGVWSDWASHGDALSPDPSLSPPGPSDVRVLAVNDQGLLQVFNPVSWELDSLPPDAAYVSGTPCALANQDGRLEAFVIGVQGDLAHISQEFDANALGGKRWSYSWRSHGTPPSGAALAPGGLVGAPSQDGRLELFAVDAGGNLWHIWQTEVNGGWSDTAPGWYSHGTPPGTTCAGTPAIAADPNGLLNLFVVGADGNLWQISQVQPSNGWSDWVSQGAPSTTTLDASPAITSRITDTQYGQLEVLAVGADSNLWHILQEASGVWSVWYSLGSPG
jgi:hypothetical protein